MALYAIVFKWYESMAEASEFFLSLRVCNLAFKIRFAVIIYCLSFMLPHKSAIHRSYELVSIRKRKGLSSFWKEENFLLAYFGTAYIGSETFQTSSPVICDGITTFSLHRHIPGTISKLVSSFDIDSGALHVFYHCCNHYWNNDNYWNNYFNSGWE